MLTYSPCLAHAMAAVLRLFVVVRVKVHVMNDDCVSCGQVDADSPGLGGQQENKQILILVVQVYQVLPGYKAQLINIVELNYSVIK